MDISKYIKELVIRNECIILPGFGGFETHYKPAYPDKISGKFVPPSKQIIFKPEFKIDNGILVKYIAEKKKLEISEARKLVEDYVKNIVYQIDLESSFTLNGFGKLVETGNGLLEFQPIEEENYLIESFGLTEISLSGTETKEDILSVTEEPEITVVAKKSKNISFLIVALAIFITMLVFLSLKYKYVDELRGFFKDRISKNESQHKVVFGHRHVPSFRDSLTGKISEKLNENTAKEKALFYKESEIKPVVDAEISKTAEYVVEKRYTLVAGSFLKESFAIELANALKKRGYNPVIIKTDNGPFRVVLETCEEIEMAIEKLEKYKKDLDNSVWILRI